MGQAYLCTTALTEFWGEGERRLFFLSPGCISYKSRKDVENFDYEVLRHPWEDRAALLEAARYEEGVYERLLGYLIEFFNEIHGERHGEDYWRIIIGPWLWHYVQAMHERYVCLNEVYNREPGLRTVLLAPSSFKIPINFADYMRKITTDPYNLQLYSSLLMAMGHDGPISEYSWNEKGTSTLGANALRKRLVHVIFRMVGACGPYLMRKLPILMADMSTPYVQVLKLVALSGFKVGWVLLPNLEEGMCKDQEGDRHPARNRLSLLMARDEEPFENVLIKTLPYGLPLCYLERYRILRHWFRRLWSNSKVRTLITSTGLIMNERFKFLAANLKEKGCKLVAIQHGGFYGSAFYYPNEIIERKVADEFWSWGWGSDEQRVRPMPSPKLGLLCSTYKKAKQYGKGHFLFVGSNVDRFHKRTWSCPPASLFEKEYLDLQIAFLRSLDKKALGGLIFRPYPGKLDLALRERLQDAIPGLSIEPPGRAYDKSLLGASLVVCDKNMTTFLKTLAANIPTIAYWNPKFYELRRSAEPYFQDLREAGILYDSPESAAHAFNQVCFDVEQWWERESVQRARKKFVRQFAWCTKNWHEKWREALLRLVCN
jgi:putative transferase (TIGR04331 family)